MNSSICFCWCCMMPCAHGARVFKSKFKVEEATDYCYAESVLAPFWSFGPAVQFTETLSIYRL